MANNDIKKLLINTFLNLNKKAVKYCVLRNYEEIPDFVGHDVDILLKEEHKDIFDKVIEFTVEELRWEKLYIRNKHKFFTVILYKIKPDNIQLLKLDLWTDLSWRGMGWIDSNYILSTKEKYKDFFIPRKGSEAAITVLKELMGGGTVPPKYYNKIIDLSLADKEGFKRSLEPIFGEFTEDLYLNVSKGKWEDINCLVKDIKHRIISSTHRNKKAHRIFGFLKHEIKERVQSALYPKGGLVALIGPDGAGKSTVIDLVTNRLTVVYPERQIFHMRFGFFPELKTGLGLTSVKKEIDTSKSVNPQKCKSKKSRLVRAIASWVVVLYYTIEFCLGHLKIWKVTSRSGLVVFDRYYYDYFVQPSYRDLIWPLRKMLLFIVPSPKAVIYLKADPEVVYKRKRELSPIEIKIQDTYFTRILSDIKNSHVINTDNKSLEEIEVEACKILIETFGYIK